ncbi:MAG TPA: ABC transporter permease [Bryobacteraceae bacterium]|nr:ABC transporter permease [Bryobacteraceae bacterium]
MRTIWNDLRYGLRMLAANPGFTAVAILSLAIGIGADTSTFSLADALLLRPLPVERPGEIVRIQSTSRAQQFSGISYPDYLDFRNQTKTLSGLAACEQTALGFQPDLRSATELKLGMGVNTEFFDVLGVKPALGRAFRPDEDRTPVVVLSDFLWQSEFAHDPNVIGRTLKLSKVDFTIIGVLPKTFPGLDLFVHESMYLPFGMLPRLGPDKTTLEARDHLYLEVFGRLAPGRTAHQAQAELQAIAHNLERAYPVTNRGRGVVAMSEIRSRTQNSENVLPIAVLLAIAGLVLLIACANVANLLLSRGQARSREIAVRLALGASRHRLFQQLITESLLLALAGGVAGLLLALFSIDFFATLRLPTTLPVWLLAKLDARVLFFAVASSVLSAIIFGVAPALHALKSDLNSALKAGDSLPSGKGRRVQARNVLAVAQISISMMLLLAAGLLIKDFSHLVHAQPGFRTDHVLVMGLDPTVAGNQEPQARAFYQQLVGRISALPGVRSVALGQNVPLGLSGSLKSVAVEGFEIPQDRQTTFSVQSSTIDERYLPLMQIPILRGRNFETSDTASSPPVAIVNETMAHKYWPNRSAVGGRIRMGGRTLEVVGVAKTIQYRDIGEAPIPFLYLPFAQQFSSVMTLHVESTGDPAALAAPVLAEIRRLDPGTPVQDLQTLDHFFKEVALIGNRIIAQVVTVIGLFGLLLASTGLYGVIAYAVSRRTREIGIRMAIGADPEGVARLVLRQGMLLTLWGVAIGLVLALALSKLLGSLLVGVSSHDPMVFLLVPLILAGVSLLACYLPARRAARVDPLLALRQE